MLTNMGFDDECGELVPIDLDFLQLRKPPLPLNFAYASAVESPTLDCLVDPVLAALALAGVYIHSCYTETALSSNATILVPPVLSGCILSEFFKVLPEAFRDDATDLCRCYPELQESVSHYTELCSGKTMRLHKLDQGVFGVLSTITLYRVSSQTDMRALEAYINERPGAR